MVCTGTCFFEMIDRDDQEHVTALFSQAAAHCKNGKSVNMNRKGS